MFQLTFVSAARAGLSWAEIDAIAVAAQRNNHVDNITGILIYNGFRFLQVIEGEREIVSSRYARICADPRHVEPRLIAARTVPERAFHGWDFACQEVLTAEDGRSFARTIADRTPLLRDRTLQMLFDSFARPDPSDRPARAA